MSAEQAAAPAPARVPLPVLRRRVLVTGVVLLALGALVTVLVANAGSRSAVQRLDDSWYRLMTEHRWPALVSLGKGLGTTFGATIDWVLRGAITLAIAVRRHWLALAGWLTTVLFSELLIGPVKGLVDRVRPPGSLIVTSGPSYPSGHAIASAVTAIGVVMALTTGRRRLYWMIAAVALAALVALSRTYLSAHWLSDVIGGSLLGSGLALAVPEAYEVARDRIRPPPAVGAPQR